MPFVVAEDGAGGLAVVRDPNLVAVRIVGGVGAAFVDDLNDGGGQAVKAAVGSVWSEIVMRTQSPTLNCCIWSVGISRIRP